MNCFHRSTRWCSTRNLTKIEKDRKKKRRKLKEGSTVEWSEETYKWVINGSSELLHGKKQI